PEQPPNQGQQGHVVSLEPQRLGQAFHGEGGVSLDPVVASLARLFRGVNEVVFGVELTHDAVNVRTVFVDHLRSSEGCATSSRIPAMEIAGSTRTNRNNSMVKRPSVPTNVA